MPIGETALLGRSPHSATAHTGVSLNATDRGRTCLRLRLIQRFDQFPGKIAPCRDFQSPFVDPRLGSIIATPLCQEPRVFLAVRTPDAPHVLKFPLRQKLPCAISHCRTFRFQHRVVERRVGLPRLGKLASQASMLMNLSSYPTATRRSTGAVRTELIIWSPCSWHRRKSSSLSSIRCGSLNPTSGNRTAGDIRPKNASACLSGAGLVS